MITIPRPVRVLIASGAATTCDTAVLLVLCHVAAWAAGPAAFAGSLAGGVINFVINRTWVFAGGHGGWLGQALRYGVIVVGGGAAVTGGAVAAGVAIGLPVLGAKAVAIGVVLVAWTYPLSARLVFAARPSGDAREATTAADPHALLGVR
jgi:putative flippase GtrA